MGSRCSIFNISGVVLLTLLASKLAGGLYAKYSDTGRKKITALLLVLVGVASFFIH